MEDTGKEIEEEGEEQIIQPDGSKAEFMVGVGVCDITPPPVDVRMIGSESGARGIHLRLYSKAFVIASNSNQPFPARVAIVVTDLWSISQAIHLEVVSRLKRLLVLEILDERVAAYDFQNLFITATGTNSSPARISESRLWSSVGLSPDIFELVVTGIVRSVLEAHFNARPASIFAAQGVLSGVNFNRSPDAYAENPSTELQRYPSNVDERMTLLKFVPEGEEDAAIGILNCFAVRCDSLAPRHRFISSDSKGLAGLYFERNWNAHSAKEDPCPGSSLDPPPFVAAFCNTAAGDVSPVNSGDGFESVRLVGRRQFEKALELFQTAGEKVHGELSSIQFFVDMERVKLSPGLLEEHWPKIASTCEGDVLRTFQACVGHPTKKEGCFFPGLSFTRPSDSLKLAHYPKTILFASRQGVFKRGFMSPSTLPLQMFRLGQFLFVGFPGEPTTMTGRRIEATLLKLFSAVGVTKVVILSHCNAYGGYCATAEEYQQQCCEGAMTLFGPWTSLAFQQEYIRLGRELVRRILVGEEDAPSRQAPLGLPPPSRHHLDKMFRRHYFALRPSLGGLHWNSGLLHRLSPGLGTVKRLAVVGPHEREKDPFFQRGVDRVHARFLCRHPNGFLEDDSLLLIGKSSYSTSPKETEEALAEWLREHETRRSYLKVQTQVQELTTELEEWITVATDADEETLISWRRVPFCRGRLIAKVDWRIPKDQPLGLYRIAYLDHEPPSTERGGAEAYTSALYSVPFRVV